MQTPYLTRNRQRLSSPTSVTDVGEDGEIHIIDEAAMDYLSKSIVSDDDPCFVLNWTTDAVMDALDSINGGLIPNLPNPPVYLDVSSPE
jgi:hypothetical protein